MIPINRNDYLNWAKEYKEQATVIEQKIEEKKQINYFKTPKERYLHDKSIEALYGMKNDCLYAMARLIKQAESMEED